MRNDIQLALVGGTALGPTRARVVRASIAQMEPRDYRMQTPVAFDTFLFVPSTSHVAVYPPLRGQWTFWRPIKCL